MPRSWIATLSAWRLVWLALPLLFASTCGPPFSREAFESNFHRPADTPPRLATHWATWDGQHYLEIAEHGYEAGRVSSAFWPLWPAVIRMFQPLAGGSALLAALFAANLLAIGGAIAFARWVEKRSGSTARSAALVALLAFPSAFFLGLPYSEALFIALAASFLAALDARRSGLAAAAAFAMTLTRPVGLFVLLPIIAWLWRERGGASSRLARTALLLSPCLGVVAYFLVHFALTGDSRGAFGIRGVFLSGQSLARLFEPFGFLTSFVAIDSLHSIRGSLLDRVTFLAIAATLPFLWKRDRVAFWYALPMTLVPAMTLRFMAFTRFALVVLPAFWIFGESLCSPVRWRRSLAWVATAISLLLQLWLYVRHTANLWAG